MNESGINISLKNKVVVITGALGEIGRKICETFAICQSDLVLVDLVSQIEEKSQFIEELINKYKINVDLINADIRKIEDIKRITNLIENKYKKVDILVNNAGVNAYVPATNIDEKTWDNIVDTNLKGTFFVSQEIGRIMIKNKEGAIVNISSQHGVVGNELRVPYCTSKAGIVNMTKALAIEWAKYNIRVNCISPTFVITEKNEKMLNERGFKSKALKEIPLGKYCTPIDVANSVLFLSTSMAALITGHNLLVDGGWVAK